jgi:hypothetical protein
MPFDLFPRTDAKSESASLFGTRGSGLDLRREYHRFVYGSSREEGHGYWIVLRHFDRSKYAEAFNRATGKGKYYQVTGEGVKGPMYPFDDIPIRVVHRDLTVSASRFQIEQSTPLGKALISYRSFYVAHDVAITESDILYEIDYVGETKPDVSPPYLRTWNIQEITPYRDRGGRTEYYQVLAGLDPISSEN